MAGSRQGTRPGGKWSREVGSRATEQPKRRQEAKRLSKLHYHGFQVP